MTGLSHFVMLQFGGVDWFVWGFSFFVFCFVLLRLRWSSVDRFFLHFVILQFGSVGSFVWGVFVDATDEQR